MSDVTDSFDGTATYYAAYRHGYPDAAFDRLRDRFGLDGTHRVLDLGTGTGRIARSLAPDVGRVVAMDPNEAMLAAGRERAADAGVTNVEWRVGSDADLDPAVGPVRLATMGRSFHWMDQDRTLDRLFETVESGGGVAILGNREWLTRGERAWQDAVHDAASEFVDPPERTGPIEAYDDPWDEKLAEAGFVDVRTEAWTREVRWTPETAVGYCLSLSFCSPSALGADQSAFERAVRSRLDAFDDPLIHEDRARLIAGRRP